MAITRGKPDECFDFFRDHVASLVSKIIPGTYPVHCDRKGARRALTFRNPSANDAIPIATEEHGEVYLYMMQALTTIQEDRRQHRLKTVEYAYKLYSRCPGLENNDALIRWEYKSTPRPNGEHCPNHVQFGRVLNGQSIRPALAKGEIDFNRVHIPTGWVLIEHVFRFLIHEFGMRPPCGVSWAEELHKSEDKFREFTA